MKNFMKIFFSILLIVIILGIIFYMVDTTRVNNEEEPLFVFNHKIVDGIDYSAKVDIGLGYKIIRFNIYNEEIIKVGTIFMDETLPVIKPPEDEFVEEISGESGEEEVKITTFGEKYKDTLLLEGIEEEVFVEDINSKLGYTMKYYYELFEYSGFEAYDRYLWNMASGDYKSLMTIYDISNEESYKEALDKITENDLFEELSGDQIINYKKSYFRSFKENDVEKVNYIYIVELDTNKLMIDLYYPREAEEGIGVYMRQMMASIKN